MLVTTMTSPIMLPYPYNLDKSAFKVLDVIVVVAQNESFAFVAFCFCGRNVGNVFIEFHCVSPIKVVRKIEKAVGGLATTKS